MFVDYNQLKAIKVLIHIRKVRLNVTVFFIENMIFTNDKITVFEVSFLKWSF